MAQAGKGVGGGRRASSAGGQAKAGMPGVGGSGGHAEGEGEGEGEGRAQQSLHLLHLVENVLHQRVGGRAPDGCRRCIVSLRNVR